MDEEAVDTTIDLNPALMAERVDSWIDGLVRLTPNILVALVVAAIAWYVARSIGSIIRRAAARRSRENLGEVVGSFARWSAFLFGVLVALTIVIPSLRPGDLIAGLGISSIAIGFAFKDILQNWLAGILILIRQPFTLGDQIVVGDFDGTVERIESRATLIRTYDNQRVVIPNSDIYTGTVTVRTAFPTRRSEYDVGIGYGDDIVGAREAILEALAGIEGLIGEPAPEVLPWGIDPSWITLRVRWWTKSDRTSVVHVQARVLAAIKEALDAAGIDMPFETQVLLVHDQTEEVDGVRGRQREGWPKPGSGAPPRPARALHEGGDGPDPAKTAAPTRKSARHQGRGRVASTTGFG
jgi:small-conductance mechanosensitive channel